MVTSRTDAATQLHAESLRRKAQWATHFHHRWARLGPHLSGASHVGRSTTVAQSHRSNTLDLRHRTRSRILPTLHYRR